MKGLIEEGEKVIAEDMNVEVRDAAIIACAQKIEHYEICGYGTARAYARELGLMEVEALLQQTLDEEYEADDKLTYLAVGRLNEKAKKASKNKKNIQESSRNYNPTGSADNTLESFTAEENTQDAISKIKTNRKVEERPNADQKKKSAPKGKGQSSKNTHKSKRSH